MRRLRLLGMMTFLSGSASLFNLPRKVTTRHRNERFRSLLARCNPLRSALIDPGEGLAEPASNDAVPKPIANPPALGKILRLRRPSPQKPSTSRRAAFTCAHRAEGNVAMSGPKCARSTIRIHSTFSTQALGRPSASERLTSHANPLACVDSGMTGTCDNDGEQIVAAEHEHGPLLVRRAETEPTNFAASNQGNSGSPSSSIGP